MNWKIFNRKIHYCASFFIALQITLIVCTGTLLLLKNQLSWVEPKTQDGISLIPAVTFDKVLAQTFPEFEFFWRSALSIQH